MKKRFVGIHLSGANTSKSAVAILSGNLADGGLEVENIFDRIGSKRGVFADDRILDILCGYSNISKVFVDVPLSLPPCVSCQRGYCPGVDACSDISVAYMCALWENSKRRKTVNPQAHRLWDVWRQKEPSFSAQQIPLVIRGRTLQRRLNNTNLQLEETNIPMSLQNLFGEKFLQYRKFGLGRKLRNEVYRRAIQQNLFVDKKLSTHVEVFEATLTALVAGMSDAGMVYEKPHDYIEDEGWVYLPKGELAGQK